MAELIIYADNIERLKHDRIYRRKFLLKFLKTYRERIISRFYRKKLGTESSKFCEFILIKTASSLLKMDEFAFYWFLEGNEELNEILSLKYLTDEYKFRNFVQKKKYSQVHLNRVIKRQLKTSSDELYALDTVIVKTDLNRYKNGKKIKNGNYDCQFVHSKSHGTVVAFIVAVLINITNFSVVKTQIYPNNAKKKDIWNEMVIDELGTTAGKIKTVLADAGFFAYDNIIISPNYRIIPVIKKKSNISIDKIAEKLNKLAPNLMFYDSRYNDKFYQLVSDFRTIIKETVQNIENYNDIAVLRAEIEILFKCAKTIFGMDNLHVYYKKHGITKVEIILYVASLFSQYCKNENVSINAFCELHRGLVDSY